jgi:hypothetical protein
MFTADGELREEYRFLDHAESAKAPTVESKTVESNSVEPKAVEPKTPEPRTPEPKPAAPPPAAYTQGAPLELPAMGPGPGFLDMVAMLAEPIPIYLGDAKLPDGSDQEDLSMARLHIDLLEVLRRKTVGNLSVQESSVLESILYQVKSRWIQKQG